MFKTDKRATNGQFTKGYKIEGKDPRKHFRNTYKGVQDVWMPEQQGKHFCQCKCGGVIIIKAHHYSMGIPRFLVGHGVRTKEGRKALVSNLPRKTKHWNWKGGATRLQDSLRRTPEYKTWRKSVFERDNYTCQECSAHSGSGHALRLEAHHVIQFSHLVDAYRHDMDKLMSSLLNVANGVTLCKPCHDKIPHTYR